MKYFIQSPFRKWLFTLTLGLFVLASVPVQAQVVFDDDVDDEVPGAPIDGLLGLGLAAGAWYGIRKLKVK